MAFGNNYNYNSTGTGKKRVVNDYSPTTYSPVKFYNSESGVDPTAMNFIYWKSLLRIQITPISVQDGSAPELEKDNSVDIYLTPSKAFLLLKYAGMFNSHPEEYNNIGIATNKGYIYFTNGTSEFGINDNDHKFIVIKLVDQNNGSIMSVIAYEFRRDYYGVANFEGHNQYQTENTFANSSEFDLFTTMLKTYVESSSYAMAASVVDSMKFDVSRLTTRINSIQEHLGIEVKTGGGHKERKNFYYQNNMNQNNNSNPTGYKSTESVDYNDFAESLIQASSSMLDDE